MNCANKSFEKNYILEQLVEPEEAANDADATPWVTFSEEIDTWARRALAANGFGDY